MSAFTGGGNLAAGLSRATAPIVAKMVGLLGSDVSLYRRTSVRAADNSSAQTWALVASAQRIAITKLSASRATRAWGAERNVTGEAITAYGLDIRDGDGVKVTAGPYTGERFLVSATPVEDAVGSYKLAALSPTHEAFP